MSSPIDPGRSFVIRGAVNPAEEPPQLALDTAFTADFTLTPEVTIGAHARGGTAEEVAVAPDAVVELELEGGVRLWVSGARLHETLELTQARGETDVLLPQLRFAAPSRGPGRWALRALRVFGVKAPAELAARALVERIEGKLALGLRRCLSPEQPLGEPIAAGELDVASPLLLLLHGTASSTLGSFGGLASANGGAAWQRLAQRYGANALALEHRTMSVSPVENALEVARALPEGARLHLVSHSRGGLVGELLARAHVAGDPFPAELLKLLRARGRVADADALAELGELLRAKRPRIERFVRVACPARGTTLASGRLDLYLSLMLNALRLVPVVGTSPAAGMLSAFVLAVAKQRTRAEELPGLEAMMPEAPLIAVLNDPQVTHDADLAVIAGDIQGSGIAGRLKVLATDLFYRENHDLVVPSASMAGGTRRARARLLFAKGAEVSHFSYFRNAATADRLVSALESEAAAGFEPITDATSGELRTRAPIDVNSDRPLVFLIPGIMGSHLTAAGDRVWLDPFDIAKGEFRRLAYDARNVEAQALMGMAYEKIAAYLSASHEVAEFPYDWRRSVSEAGDRLAQLVEGVLEANPRRTVRLLAHSMGGLVARAMIARHPDLWQRITARPGGRLVMLGTPNGGSWVIPRVLLEQESVVKKLAMLDLRHSQQELLRYIADFTGMLELLPHDHPLDFFAAERWDGIRRYCGDRFALPSAARLAEAAALPQALRHAVDPRHMAYVCGRAPATPIDYEFTGNKPGSMRVRFLATAEGDGRVPWSTGVLPGVPTWYMDVVHGDMAAHPPTFAAIRELLEHGTTMLLPTQPPVARGTTEKFELLPEEPLEYPTAADLQADALGRAAVVPVVPSEPELPLTVAVVHGNLAYSPHPVAVGHYQDDVIVGAEAVLDRQFGSALSELRALGRYAGPRGSARVLLRPDATPPGAIVVGLGAVGELTGAALEDGFRQAVLEYANRAAEEVGTAAGGVPRSIAITSLLIGSGRGGISTADAVQAIVAGTLAARRALHGTSVAARVSLDRLEFCELYQDVAIHALRSLYTLAEDARVAPRIAVQEELLERPGARRRASFEPEAEWWERLQIAETPEGHLAFQNLTERARAEARLQGVDRHTLDLFVRDAMRGIEDDPATARTLFALLLPRAVREQAPCRGRMVLVVNEGAARYPWELLRDSPAGDTEPLAVQRPLIRQLVTRTFDEHPLTAAAPSALVIGDPPTGWAPRLPGARSEAKAVAAALRGASFRTQHLDEPPARTVLGTLLAEPYRVLHIAAHGVYRHALADGRTVTGVVLSDGAVIGTAEIVAMHPVPELVFLNCCHTGFIEAAGGVAGAGSTRHVAGADVASADYPRLAANLATQLIQAGVRAVVAAGWAVHDDAALTFARTFYDRMLAGRAFGEAVHAARREAYFQHPAYNTWGAYQCYGDPDYTLLAQRDYAPAPPRRFTCAAELVIEFENLVQDTAYVAQFGAEQLRVRLDALGAQVPERWRTRPELVAARERAEIALARATRPVEPAAVAPPAAPAAGSPKKAAAPRRPAPDTGPVPIEAWVVPPHPDPAEASPPPPRRRRKRS